MVDIYHSRRGNFRLCRYYLRDENNQTGDLSKWVLENAPEGEFYAMEYSDKSNQMNQLGNSFAFDRNVITLKTNDNVNNISRGCVVEYLNHAWLVTSVSFIHHRNESEFSVEEYSTIINLTR